jgi:hypothetical protein
METWTGLFFARISSPDFLIRAGYGALALAGESFLSTMARKP